MFYELDTITSVFEKKILLRDLKPWQKFKPYLSSHCVMGVTCIVRTSIGYIVTYVDVSEKKEQKISKLESEKFLDKVSF